MTDTPEPTGRFASLAIPEFRRLWWGGVFVFLAMQTQQIARSWLAYELTGTNTALGGVLIGFGVAGLVAIPTGGVLADRFTKRTILVAKLIQTIYVHNANKMSQQVVKVRNQFLVRVWNGIK